MIKSNEITAIVVTYNRCEMLDKCLDAIRKQDTKCDTIVIDNASTDETPSVIEKFLGEGMHYVRLESNCGGAGGFCRGLKESYSLGYKYFWLMDDDTIPEVDALSQLISADALLNHEYGFLSSAAIWTDGSMCRMNLQSFKKNHCDNVLLLSHGIIEIKKATFVSFFVKREMIEKVGLPIKEFFIWADDVEFSRRITIRFGIPSYLVAGSKVVHAMKDNKGSSLADASEDRISRYRYAYRNENYLYRKEGLKGWGIYTARCLLHIGRIISRSKGHKLYKIWIILSEYFKGLLFNPKIEMIDCTDPH